LLLIFFLFFFYLYVDHPDLHSFPTRRSSDLRKWHFLLFGLRIPDGCLQSSLGHVVAADTREQIPHFSCGREFLALDHRPKIIAKDRKSTRLNSSHVSISYAVFCLKKKKKNKT